MNRTKVSKTKKLFNRDEQDKGDRIRLAFHPVNPVNPC
jgi:hypothetical protein